jgi:hypothetical protein
MGEAFANLEKIRHNIIKETVQNGIEDFKKNPGKQEVLLRFSQPVLKTLLTLIEKKIETDEIEEESKRWREHLEQQQED